VDGVDERRDLTVAVNILVVCTANVCRSPMIAALLEQQLQRRGVVAEVRSAGTVHTSHTVQNETVEAGLRLGVDLTEHRRRTVTPDIVASEGSDLVLCAAAEHLRELVVLDRSVMQRVFTLKELVSLSRAVGPAETFDEWVTAAANVREMDDLVRGGSHVDIADPFGRPLAAHLAMAEEAFALTRDLAALGAWRRAAEHPRPTLPAPDPATAPVRPSAPSPALAPAAIVPPTGPRRDGRPGRVVMPRPTGPIWRRPR
jgi:protein-tyrosine phosphatase